MDSTLSRFMARTGQALGRHTVELIGGLTAAGALGLAVAVAQDPQAAAPRESAQASGEHLFKARCAACHDPAVDRAPNRAELAANIPENIVTSLTTGAMAPMAAGMTDEEIVQVARWITGRSPKTVGTLAGEADNVCAENNRFDPAGPSWNGWSPDKQNTRRQADVEISPDEVPLLKVKWAFKIDGARYGQPTVVGNRVFASSSSGRVYALDKETGCVDWAFTAPSGVRVTVSIGRNDIAPSGYAAYFGSQGREVFALDAASGRELWKVKVEDHARAILSGAPIVHDGVIYQPTSSWEESTGGLLAYECCKFRGAVVAIDTRTGEILWKTYMVADEPRPHRKNSAGTQMYGPAGSAIWSAPTIDPKRGLVYVATGDSYTDIEDGGSSDAIVALDMKTGAIRWRNQVTDNDNFMTGCRAGEGNCPIVRGPDHDFGASPVLVSVGGRDIVLSGQKSAVVHAMDADTGRLLWQTKVGAGSALGGIQWGIASDGATIYAANGDPSTGNPGLTAIDVLTGEQRWQVRAPAPACSWEGRCRNGFSAPPSLIPGVVVAGAQDGHVRAYDVRDGRLIWDFDTAGHRYDTVNGVKGQRGGQLDGTGPTFAGDMMFMMSGYNGSGGGGWSDNVLLAFSVNGK